MITRKVRWNRRIDSGEQVRMRFRYTVAILNRPKEIERILDRFFEQLAPIDEIVHICNTIIPKYKGIHCRIVSFSSERDIKYPDKIYKKRDQFRKDRDLRETTESELEKYISGLIS